jgi:hypothetical protein
MFMLTRETFVASHLLLLKIAFDILHAEDPMCSTLMKPPHDFELYAVNSVDTLQLEQDALLTLTMTSETLVDSLALLLLGE